MSFVLHYWKGGLGYGNRLSLFIPHYCPEHNSKSIFDINMKLHIQIHLIDVYNAQELWISIYKLYVTVLLFVIFHTYFFGLVRWYGSLWLLLVESYKGYQDDNMKLDSQLIIILISLKLKMDSFRNWTSPFKKFGRFTVK